MKYCKDWSSDEWWIKKESHIADEQSTDSNASLVNKLEYEIPSNKINEDVWDYDSPMTNDEWEKSSSFADYIDKKKRTPKEKKEKPIKEKPPKKVFKVGDIVILVKKEQKKLPDDAYEFLLTYSKFEVKEVNENGNLYLGFDRNGEHFMFAPNRFELKPLDKSKPIEKDPFDFEDED